jgi:beta-lactamase class A
MFLPLKDSLETLIEDAELSGDIDAAAIYFRDLNSTFWFGINEDDSYVTASLFKLPVAIAAYRQGEDDPFFFQRKAYYTQEIAKENNPAQGAAPSVLVVGKGYYIKDLVRLMIVDSDNGAKDLLIASIDKKHTEDVFDFSALIEPDVKRQYSLSPKNYSIFFRILYSGTYLSKENSNDLLKLLTESSFKDGIVSGVDSSVKVAHKFGLYVINRPTAGSPGEEELHDCGIIYHPRHPYLLCIMTKGKSDVSLKRFISKASQIVYKNVGADYDQ